jgi:DNA-binding transcriptional LysR family regulator
VELRQLRYVVTVAEERHFGRAAERLHIGQPAVSQQIRRLERELGVALFDRSPRHVRLTEAGQRFLPAAREVLAAEERARAAVTAAPGSRVVRLGTSTGLGANLERVLDAVRQGAPELTVELVAGATQARLERVAAGELDAAFVRGPVEHPQLRAVPVWRDELLAALPARHPLAAGPDVALADLATVPLRMTERRHNPPLVDLVMTACHAAGFEPVPGAASVGLQDTLATIGSGRPLWTVVYASHARVLRPSRVAFLPFRAPGLSITTALVVRRDGPTPHLGALLAACAAPEDHDHDR